MTQWVTASVYGRSSVRLLLACCALLGASGCPSRLLGCDQQPTPRSRQICEALADHREIALGAKSIPYPQWRTELGTPRDIYCELGISAADAPELKRMSERAPQALAIVAHDLYELVTPSLPLFMSQHTDPKDPAYYLKDGCPGKTPR